MDVDQSRTSSKVGDLVGKERALTRWKDENGIPLAHSASHDPPTTSTALAFMTLCSY